MKTVFTKEWIKCAAVRAIRTVAQTAAATLGTSAVLSEVDWLFVLPSSVLAGIYSILSAVAGLPEVEMDMKNKEKVGNEDDTE